MFPYDAIWYRQVIAAMALDIDMAILTEGDQTLVGNLSGGQKQRVALARAVYGRFDTYALDDVFSALDATTESHVFSALFGDEGLLHGKSVIMATNQVYRLSRASEISYLENGRIAEQGTYDALMENDGLLAGLVNEFTTERKEEIAPVAKAPDDALVDLTEVAEGEKQEEGELSAKGGVKWSTYGLYLRGMGLVSACICEPMSQDPVTPRRLMCRARTHRHLCRSQDLCPGLPAGLDNRPQCRLASISLWPVPRRVYGHANRPSCCVLRGEYLRLYVRPSEGR